VWKQIEVLENESDLLSQEVDSRRMRLHPHPHHEDFPRSNTLKPINAPEDCALAGSTRPNDNQDFSSRQRQTDPAQDVGVTERLMNVNQPYDVIVVTWLESTGLLCAHR
jgi:hypothetical protein